jgi:hypothetical protein
MNDSECPIRPLPLTDSLKRLRPNHHYQDEVEVDTPFSIKPQFQNQEM